VAYGRVLGGGAAVLLEKPESDVEVYNDISGDLVAFFKVARDRPDDLIEWIQSTPYSRQLHNEYTERIYGDGKTPDDAVERAGMFLYTRTSSFGGKIYSNDGRLNPAFKPPQKDGYTWRDFGGEYRRKSRVISEISDRLRNATIENKSYEYIIKRYDSPSTLFYFDPPYVDAESYYGNDFEHEAFISKLQEVDGKFILSYGDNLPDGVETLRRVTRDIQRAIGNKDGDGDRMTERLLLNFDPDDATPFAGKEQSGVTDFV